MARIGGTCYFKIDGQQLSLTGGIEVPMNRTVNDDIIGLGFNKVYVTNDDQATNTENLQFITTRAINAGDKTSWNGNFSNLGWGNTIPW